MNVLTTSLPGVLIVEPRAFTDARGVFLETWHCERYAEHGLQVGAQDNVSWSHRGVVRGLHFQQPRPQAKLVQVLNGHIFDVAVDIRVGSPTRGQWFGVELTSENRRQLYIPAGFAHGFCSLADNTAVAYKCSDTYQAAYDRVVAWNDPDLGIAWPVDTPILSAKDAAAPRLSEMPHDALPRFS